MNQQSSTAQATSAATPATPAAQQVIALVDDDRNILASVSIALQSEGFATRVYTDGATALKALTEKEFVRILSQTRASLTDQYKALLGTEDVTITFTEDGIAGLARIAAEVNDAVENIGARRLQTVMEKLLEDVSFAAEDLKGETLTVDAAFVDKQLAGIARNADLSRYVL